MKKRTEHVDLELKDGVLYGKFNPNIKIDLNTAKKIVQDRIDFQNGVAYPMFIYFNNHQADKEAREYMNNEGTHLITKGAFYTDSILTAIFVNFFLKVYKPKVPAKMFTDKEKAIAWLKKDV